MRNFLILILLLLAISVAIATPQYSNISDNDTIKMAGDSVRFNTYWTLNDSLSTASLSGYIFSFDNGTGTFVNDSWAAIAGQFTGTNFTINGASYDDGYFPRGIYTNGTYFWIVIRGLNIVDKFYMNGTYINNFSVTPDVDGNMNDITGNTTHLWLIEYVGSTAKVFHYTIDGAYISNITLPSYPASTPVTGITNNGTHFWIVGDDLRVYQYNWSFGYLSNFSTTSRVTAGTLHWVYSDGTYIWTGGVNGEQIDKWYVNGTYAGEEYTLSSANHQGGTITTDGVYYWTTRINDGLAYQIYKGVNYWSNVTKTINSTINSTIRWQIYANDSNNNWNVTSPIQSFQTGGILFTQNQTNSTEHNRWIKFSVLLSDAVGLSHALFSFDNGTGTFVNDSWTALSGTSSWFNNTKFINSIVNKTIRWQIYANNSGGFNYTSDTYSFSSTWWPVGTNASVSNNTPTIIASNTTLDQTNYSWYVSCTDGDTQTNSSEVRYFIHDDNNPPTYSNIIQDFNGTPDYRENVTANTTWTASVNLTEILFESNYTGTPANYTIISDAPTNTYVASYTIDSGNWTKNQSYYWKFYARTGNASAGYNVTPIQQYITRNFSVNIAMPTGTSTVDFNITSMSDGNYSAKNQTTTTPIFNITNNAASPTLDEYVRFNLNTTLVSCLTVYWANKSNVSTAAALNITPNVTTISSNLTSGSNIGVWLWAGLVNCINVTTYNFGFDFLVGLSSDYGN